MTRLILIFILTLSSCAYKPVSYYAKDSLGERIYTKVFIPIESPEFAVSITDAIRQSITTKFKGRIETDPSKADCIINISNAKHSITDLKTNKEGVVTLHKATVKLTAQIKNAKFNKIKVKAIGSYDYSDDPSISQGKDLQAIKEASKRAFDALIVSISTLNIKPKLQ